MNNKLKPLENKNIINAIEGLAQYMDAISRMNQGEFDYCYNKLIRQGLNNWQIEKYLISLRES